MARRGDAVECPCGRVLKLENDRVPWHKKLDSSLNCMRSGVPAENWEAVHVVSAGGVPLVLSCPACGEKERIRNAPEGLAHPLACGACGVAGSLQEFVVAFLARRAKSAAIPTSKRYVG